MGYGQLTDDYNIVDDEPKRVSAFGPDIVTHTVVDARLRHG